MNSIDLRFCKNNTAAFTESKTTNACVNFDFVALVPAFDYEVE